MYIIGIAGKAESGKTTFGMMLKESFEAEGKRVLMINYADAVKYIAKQYYNWNGEKDEYGRSLLQEIGTEKGREGFYEDVWIMIVNLFINVMRKDFDVFIIGDCRFPNEVYYWKEIPDTYSIKIIRDNHISQLTEEQKQHPSETSLDNISDFDFIIANNEGLDKLKEWSKSIVENILSRRCNSNKNML